MNIEEIQQRLLANKNIIEYILLYASIYSCIYYMYYMYIL